MKVVRAVVQILLVAGALAGAWFAAQWFIEHRLRAERAAPESKALLVEVMRARASGQKVSVWAMGTVVPAVQIELQAEVSGRIVKQHPELIPGGRFEAGEVIVQIDSKDYRFAVDKQEAAVEKALFDRKVEQGRAAVASREWKLLDGDVQTTDEGRALALREPHLRNAEAALAAASGMYTSVTILASSSRPYFSNRRPYRSRIGISCPSTTAAGRSQTRQVNSPFS